MRGFGDMLVCASPTETLLNLLGKSPLVIGNLVETGLHSGWGFGQLVYGCSPTRITIQHL